MAGLPPNVHIHQGACPVTNTNLKGTPPCSELVPKAHNDCSILARRLTNGVSLWGYHERIGPQCVFVEGAQDLLQPCRTVRPAAVAAGIASESLDVSAPTFRLSICLPVYAVWAIWTHPVDRPQGRICWTAGRLGPHHLAARTRMGRGG
jgi:hypothetical protein